MMVALDMKNAPMELVELALKYHKADKPDGEGEYGCPGISCPGVQRLVKLLIEARGLSSPAPVSKFHVCSDPSTCHECGKLR